MYAKVLRCYLETKGHLKCRVVKNLKGAPIDNAVRTKTNVIDYDIFCMGHMESHFGEGKEWQSEGEP